MKSFQGLLCIVFFLCVVKIWGLKYNTLERTIVRVTPHVPKVIDKTCLLKPMHGPCRANIDMYYFNPSAMNCSIFAWGGCQGNGNRFDTLEECLGTCLSQPGKKTRPRYCTLKFDYGFCFGDTKRWYYDSLWQVCKEVIYSGCGGNKNNFYSQEQCDSVCRFGLGPITISPTRAGIAKKVLIANPLDAKPRRDLAQPSQPKNNSNAMQG